MSQSWLRGLHIVPVWPTPVTGEISVVRTGACPVICCMVCPVSRSILRGATSHGLFSICIQNSAIAICLLLGASDRLAGNGLGRRYLLSSCTGEWEQAPLTNWVASFDSRIRAHT